MTESAAGDQAQPSSAQPGVAGGAQSAAPVGAGIRRAQVARAVASGGALALVGALIHRHIWLAGSIEIPWAAALVVAATCTRIRVMRHEDGDGRRCGVFALTWLAVTTLIALLRTNDLVIASDVMGVGYLLVGALTVGVAAGWPSRAERQRWAELRR